MHECAAPETMSEQRKRSALQTAINSAYSPSGFRSSILAFRMTSQTGRQHRTNLLNIHKWLLGKLEDPDQSYLADREEKNRGIVRLPPLSWEEPGDTDDADRFVLPMSVTTYDALSRQLNTSLPLDDWKICPWTDSASGNLQGSHRRCQVGEKMDIFFRAKMAAHPPITNLITQGGWQEL